MGKWWTAGLVLAIAGIVVIMAWPCHQENYTTWAVVLYLAGVVSLIVAAAGEGTTGAGRLFAVLLVVVLAGGTGFTFGIMGAFRCWQF